MEDTKNYVVELSTDEIHSLLECLAELRKYYANNLDNARENPVFVVASKLQHKFAHVVSPETKVPLDKYLDYGK